MELHEFLRHYENKTHNTDSKYNRQIVFTSLNTYNDNTF